VTGFLIGAALLQKEHRCTPVVCLLAAASALQLVPALYASSGPKQNTCLKDLNLEDIKTGKKGAEALQQARKPEAEDFPEDAEDKRQLD